MRAFFWRLRQAPKDYHYGGCRAALRWIFKGVAADETD